MKPRKFEYFENYNFHKSLNRSVFNVPRELHYQERDWTCSIAVLRSITSSVLNIGTEDEIVDMYGFTPGPHYSQEFKDKGVLDEKAVISCYGCDNPDMDFSDIVELLKNGFYVGINSMINFDHWVVLMGYSKLGNYDEDMVVYYCPYFNEVRSARFSEFVEMWRSGEYAKNGVVKDFIAIKPYT